MILLTPDKYNLAIPQLKQVTINNLFARAVVEHHIEGKIYVDDASNPNAFYVIHPYGMSLLYGKISDNFLQHHLKNHWLNAKGLRNANEYLQIFPTELENRIDKILGKALCIYDSNKEQNFSNYIVIKHKRVNFKFNPRKFKLFLSNVSLEKYNFCKVDEYSYNETHGSVVPNQFWNNANDFMQYGVGYSLIYDNQSVAIAFSAFIHDNMLELGMETKEEYRRNGFASIVSAKLISYCIENKLEPIWACRLANQASYNLAMKLGFEPVVYLPYYELTYSPPNKSSTDNG